MGQQRTSARKRGDVSFGRLLTSALVMSHVGSTSKSGFSPAGAGDIGEVILGALGAGSTGARE